MATIFFGPMPFGDEFAASFASVIPMHPRLASLQASPATGWTWLLRCTLDPLQGFRDRATLAPPPGRAFLRFLALRLPLSLAEVLLLWNLVRRGWLELLRPESRVWEWVLTQAPTLSRADLALALQSWPRPPDPGTVLPWLLGLAVLGLLGLWTHHVVWDHGCLKLLGGTRTPAAWRRTLQAESEALSVGSLGAAVGLLGYLPGFGCLLSPLVTAAGIWFWVLRGFALAAFHGCETWRGVLATLLHALLASLFYGLLVLVLALSLLRLAR